MTDNDDVLNELKGALAEDPSRAFADGVRARVHRSQTNTRRMWWGLAAAASIGLATMALWRPTVEVPAMVSAVPTPPERVVVAPRATRAPAPVVRREAAVVRAVVTANAGGPRLEVLTNQAAVLRQLWADHQRRPTVVADSEHVVGDLSTKAIEVNPVVVAPIVVSEIGKEPGPAGATPIIRRAEATKETR